MKVTWDINLILSSVVKYTALMSSIKGRNDKSLIKLFLDIYSNPGGQYILPYLPTLYELNFHSLFRPFCLDTWRQMQMLYSTINK